MNVTALIIFIYATLILVGGVIGFCKAGSIPSLISGIVFDVLLSICAVAMLKKKAWGQYTALILTFIIDAFFTLRFTKTLQFFPAGFMSLLSLVVLIILALQIRKK